LDFFTNADAYLEPANKGAKTIRMRRTTRNRRNSVFRKRLSRFGPRNRGMEFRVTGWLLTLDASPGGTIAGQRRGSIGN
jgi:hypothetical protein